MDKLNPKIYNTIKDGEFPHYRSGYIPREMLFSIADKCSDIFAHKTLSLKRIYGEKAQQMQYEQMKTKFINTLDQVQMDEQNYKQQLEKIVEKIVNDYFNFEGQVSFDINLEHSFNNYEDQSLVDAVEDEYDDYDTYIKKHNKSSRDEIMNAFLVGAVEIASKSIFSFIDDIEMVNQRLGKNYALLYTYMDYIYWSGDDDLINREIKMTNGVDSTFHDSNSIAVNVFTSNFVFGVKAAFLGVFSMLLGINHQQCYGGYHWHKRIGEILYSRIMENCRDTSAIINIFKKVRNMEDDELKSFVKELLINSKKFKNSLKSDIY
jgi:hypothetical protein